MVSHKQVIDLAIKYLQDRGGIVPADIADALGYKPAVKQFTSYQAAKQELWAVIYDSVYGFLSGTARVDTYKSPMVTTVSQIYIETADIAYVDGGGTLPLDEETANWARLELAAQLSYIDLLFTNLKQLRKEDFDALSEAFRRANGYVNSLDAFYNSIKVAGAGNKMLTFDGNDGKESCSDCKKYKGQRHRASWWMSHDAVPPNRSFECHGYNCEHRLFDDDGKEFTV